LKWRGTAHVFLPDHIDCTNAAYVVAISPRIPSGFLQLSSSRHRSESM